NIQVGQSWPDELVDALRSCHAFVALYSPSYFRSDMCRQEWRLFAQRERAYQETHGLRKPPGLLLPVLWLNPSRDQSIPSAVQYSHGDFGDVYAAKGAKYLLRLGREHAEDYQRFLMAFAERLVDAVDEHALPPTATLHNPGPEDPAPGPGGAAGSGPEA